MATSKLSRSQRKAAAVLGRTLASRGFALAGGAALQAHGVGDRTTDDLDSFTSLADELPAAFDVAISALRQAGFEVTVDRRYDTFCRLEVVSGRTKRRPFGVDLGVDSIMWQPDATAFGPTLSIRELAANKVLTAFGRNEPRDLYDLEQLSSRVSLRRAVRDASAKDLGFDAQVFTEMISMTLSKPTSEWPAGTDLAAVRRVCALLVSEARAATAGSGQGDGLDLGTIRDRSEGMVAPYRRRDGTYVRGYRRHR